MAYDPRTEPGPNTPPPPPPQQQQEPPPPPPPPPPPAEEEEPQTGGPLIDLDLSSDTDVDGDAGDGSGGLLSGLDFDATVGGDGDGEAASLIDIDANNNTDVDGDAGDGSGGLLSGLDVDATVGQDGDGEAASLIDIDANADTIGGIDDPIEGDLLGGDLLGDELLDGIDVGDTLAQLGAGDLLDTGFTEDLSDVGAITGIIDEVVDTTSSTVDGLMGETDLFNILDTDGLLGDS